MSDAAETIKICQDLIWAFERGGYDLLVRDFANGRLVNLTEVLSEDMEGAMIDQLTDFLKQTIDDAEEYLEDEEPAEEMGTAGKIRKKFDQATDAFANAVAGCKGMPVGLFMSLVTSSVTAFVKLNPEVHEKALGKALAMALVIDNSTEDAKD